MSRGLYGETDFHWRKPSLTKHQAFHDVSLCIDKADALGNKTVHQMTMENMFVQNARLLYDVCMRSRGYLSWELSATQRERLTSVKSNGERAEILAEFASSPPSKGTKQFSRSN